jgi:cation transport regulator ChaC
LLFAYGGFLLLVPENFDPAPERARLTGWRTGFAARSTVEWGTRANPAPVLALVEAPAASSSRGIVLDLSHPQLDEMVARWSEGEGMDRVVKGQAEVGLPFRRDPAQVTALTVQPQGPGWLGSLPVERLARMAVVARGRRGTGVDYLRTLIGKLHEWGLADPAVEALWKEVQKERGEKWR